jgi:hypothetical protein
MGLIVPFLLTPFFDRSNMEFTSATCGAYLLGVFLWRGDAANNRWLRKELIAVASGSKRNSRRPIVYTLLSCLPMALTRGAAFVYAEI